MNFLNSGAQGRKECRQARGAGLRNTTSAPSLCTLFSQQMSLKIPVPRGEGEKGLDKWKLSVKNIQFLQLRSRFLK